MQHGDELRVMMSTPAPEDRTNPYITMLARELSSAGVHIEFFSWQRLLSRKVDVLHIHWPERLIAGTSFTRRAVKRSVLLAFLTMRRLFGVKIVRTMHNLRPHDGTGKLDRWILDRVDRETDHFIYLNDAEARPSSSSVIPHGHYRDWYGEPTVEPTPGTYLLCGLLRPYKGIEQLIEAARSTPDINIEISGYAPEPEYAARIVELASGIANVRINVGHLDDNALVDAISRSEGVVLPYQNLYNSGVLFLAMSLERPVIIPDGPASASYAEEFGEQWVARFAQPLNGTRLATAVADLREHARERASEVPQMVRREWPAISEAHRATYIHVVTTSNSR